MRSGAIRRFGSYFVDNFILNFLSLPFLLIISGRIFDLIEIAIDFENGYITESSFLEVYFTFMYEVLGLAIIYSLITFTIYYAIIPIFWKGKSIGRVVCGCYVQTTDGSDLTFTKLFIREIIFKLLWWTVTFGIGGLVDILMIALREDRFTIRDIVSKTEVIEADGESVKKQYQDF